MRHSGYSFEALRTSIEEMIAGLPNVVTKINTFTARELNQAEMNDLAQKAYNLRNTGRQATPEEISAILTPRRDADRPNNLWTVFNRVQEAIITGGSLLVDARGRMRSSKPIRSLDKGLKLNQELWQLAEQMA